MKTSEVSIVTGNPFLTFRKKDNKSFFGGSRKIFENIRKTENIFHQVEEK